MAIGKAMYKPPKYWVTPPSVHLRTNIPADVLVGSVRVNPHAKEATSKSGERFPTHRVLKHGGQTNHVI